MFKEIYYKIERNFPLIKVVKKLYIKTKSPRRYKYLLEIIKNHKVKKIMEIGTWNGNHALQMIEEAKKYSSLETIQYYGFDLFESLDNKTTLKEFAKTPPLLEVVCKKLKKTNVKINLYQGFTQDTLPKVISKLPKMDFIFIDGGHSIETIKSDWQYVKRVMNEDTIVIFDDYWNIDNSGCKEVIEGIDKTKFKVTILPIQDKFKKKWGILKINFVKVKMMD
jgi:predicted O-methyltransferase YrrM